MTASEFFFGGEGDENVLELGGDDGCTTYAYTKNHQIAGILWYVNCIYGNKAPICPPSPGLWRVLVGVTGPLSPGRLLIDMVPRVRQTRHYEMFE